MIATRNFNSRIGERLQHRQLLWLLLVSWLLVCCNKPEEDDDASTLQEAAKVQVITLEPQTWRQTIRTFGVIEAAEKVTVSAEFSGKVSGVFFSEGQEIEAGQRLVTFNLSEQRMRFKQAEGSLAEARARMEEARKLAKRREDLYRQKAISKEQLDMYRASLASTEARYEQMLVGRSLAKHQLKRTTLESPVKGTVVSKNIEEGEVAMPGQALAIIQVTETMRVVTYVTESEINTVQIGAECTLTTPGVRGRVYKAYIERRGDAADPKTGNYPVMLTVENRDGLLRTGMTAVVTLKGLEVNDALLIPDTAVVDRKRERVVFRLKDGRAESVPPVLAATTETMIPVLHGLEVGDTLIVGGLDNVVHGTKVEVLGTAELPALPKKKVRERAPTDTEKTPVAEKDSAEGVVEKNER